MKAKLIKKTTGIYKIECDGKLIASTDDDMNKHLEISKLSLKNCQAIERGHDLDNCVDYFEKGKLYIQQDGVIILAGENGNNGIIIQDPLGTRGVGHYSDEWNPKAFCEFKQKAIELMGDKKFSKEDIEECWETAHQAGRFEEKGIAKKGWQTSETFIQSLQQSEWLVEIEMKCRKVLVNGYKNQPANVIGFVAAYEEQLLPKLDADGCLILKLK